MRSLDVTWWPELAWPGSEIFTTCAFKLFTKTSRGCSNTPPAGRGLRTFCMWASKPSCWTIAYTAADHTIRNLSEFDGIDLTDGFNWIELTLTGVECRMNCLFFRISHVKSVGAHWNCSYPQNNHVYTSPETGSISFHDIEVWQHMSGHFPSESAD